MNRIILVMLASLAASTAACTAEPAPEIIVEDAWARATAPGQANAAAYLVIRNDGDDDVRLVGASSDLAMASLHRTLIEDGIASMRSIEGGITIGAGDYARLEPQGDHVMLMGLSAPLAAGDSFDIALDFEGAEDQTITVEVVEPGSR